ncbi:MAG TPA: LysM domain-containing protein [Roseiflexaceae bacterium]|nr:LysM domain-containing protein [Roseiflexaceae bacterium]
MSQFLVLLLLTFALVLPVVGAGVLRLLAPRIAQSHLTAAAALIFATAAGSVLVLARSDVSRVRVGGLTVLLPVSAPPEEALALPPGLEGATAAPDPSDADHADHGEPGAAPAPPTLPPPPTAPPTATSEPTEAPTATLEPTASPEPPTATLEPPTATPEPAGARRYTVQSGDTLRSIAEQFGVSVPDLLRANQMTPEEADSLRPGQELVIP